MLQQGGIVPHSFWWEETMANKSISGQLLASYANLLTGILFFQAKINLISYF
jgi:hypothetical protein